VTNVANIEKYIECHKKHSLRQTSTNLKELKDCLKREDWKKLFTIDSSTDSTDSFIIDYIVKNNEIKVIIFIDKKQKAILAELIINAN